MKIAIPDLISNSYFPAAAAVELGIFKDEGLDMELELIFPVNRTLEVLKEGEIQFVGVSAHSIPQAFPEWAGGQLLAALAQGMYWFLILKTEFNVAENFLDFIENKFPILAATKDNNLKEKLTEIYSTKKDYYKKEFINIREFMETNISEVAYQKIVD